MTPKKQREVFVKGRKGEKKTKALRTVSQAAVRQQSYYTTLPLYIVIFFILKTGYNRPCTEREAEIPLKGHGVYP